MGDRVAVKFLSGREEVGVMVSWGEDGIRLRLDGVSSPVYFSWAQIDRRCSEGLRKRFLGKRVAALPGDTVEGWRVIPRKEIDFFPIPRILIVEGMKLSSEDPGEIRIKVGARTWVFRRDNLAYIAPVRVNRAKVLTGGELESEVLKRVRPRDAEGWDKVGHELVLIGMRDRGLDAFQRAEILRRPDLPEGRIYRELARLRRKMETAEFQSEVLRAQDFFLAREIPTVVEILKVVGKAVDGDPLAAEVDRLIREIGAWWQSSREEKVVREWSRVIDSLIRARVSGRSGSLAEAEAWILKDLLQDVDKLVRLRFGFSPGDPDPRDLWDDRSVADIRKHSYGEGSWIRVRRDLGDPEEWWKEAEPLTRVAFLKGLAVEEAFRVLWAGEKNCSTCGGKGALFPSGSQGEICPACRGLKTEKVLFYR
jgi:hypothetical protein